MRLVFCLYAEDANVFQLRQFHDYLVKNKEHARTALFELFKVLDTPEVEREPYIDEDLAAFPYVNGGLFREEKIEIPRITPEILCVLTRDASEQFDWSGISPTIFGAVFESTLNPETRRQGGMHYTSIENIHKLIDPLFLNELREELRTIKALSVETTRRDKLVAFQEKLGALTFLDPACGSGNFLTETFISLRRLENEALRIIYPQGALFSADDQGVIKVKIGQFYGIEINDFAMTVAKTALWIAESQTLQETEDILNCRLNFLPLKSYSNIVEGNALKIDWRDVVDPRKLAYVMGNPPFVGYSNQTKEQKEDIRGVYVDENGTSYKAGGKIDYVAGWYFKTCEFMLGTEIQAAFVSTNSVSQGEQVEYIWKPLMERFKPTITFAYRTFQWASEATSLAHVHCVVIGFTLVDSDSPKFLFDEDTKVIATNINPYLIDAPNIIVESRSKPLENVPAIVNGSKATDGGFLFLSSQERNDVLASEPKLDVWIRPFLGAEEFINNKERYCFWLEGITPQQIRASHILTNRIKSVKEFRLNSTKEQTKRDADVPWLFQQIRQPNSDYLLIPRTSSERRRYVPIGYVDSHVICSDSNQLIPNAALFHFAILTSNVHMAWMRVVCGRLESRYRYSAKIVYNNFPWPDFLRTGRNWKELEGTGRNWKELGRRGDYIASRDDGAWDLGRSGAIPRRVFGGFVRRSDNAPRIAGGAQRERPRCYEGIRIFNEDFGIAMRSGVDETLCGIGERLIKRRAQSRAPGVFYRVSGIAPVGRGRRRETRKRERIGAEGVAKRNAERDE